MIKLKKITALLVAATTIACLAYIMYRVELKYSNLPPGILLEDGKLRETQNESIKTTIELTKILIAWVIGVIATTSFFLKANIENSLSIRKLDLVLSFSIIIISIISLFYGHLMLDKIAYILSLDQFPIENKNVREIGRLQYVYGLSAISLFGLHVFQFFWYRVK